MRLKNLYKSFIFASGICLFGATTNANNSDTQNKYTQDDFRNMFGLSWMGNAKDALQYAKNVGHRHIMYMHGMENDKNSNGMTFYIESPEYGAYERSLDFTKKYTPEEIAEFEKMCTVVFPEKPFPQNMATGWFFSKDRCSLQLDFQQQKVHQIAIERIMKRVDYIEKRAKNFKLGGFAWDVPQPYGDYNIYNPKSSSLNRQITLKYWTAEDSSPERPGIKHDYKTHFEGYFEYYRAIMEAARKHTPNAKFIVEPYVLDGNWIKYFDSDFIKSKGEDAKKYKADWILEEGHTVNFCTKEDFFKDTGITPETTGSSSPDVYDEKTMRKIAATASIKGSWTCWYGRAGGSGNAPRAKTLHDIPARMKLGKLIATWENLNNTPLASRSFDGTVYTSPTAYMSPDAYSAIQPETNKMFFVFITDSGKITVPEGWEIEAIHHLDGLFGVGDKVRKGVLKQEGKTITPFESGYANLPFVAFLKKIENK